MERFWDKVKIGKSDGCWEWQACRNVKGYGNFGYKRKVQLAHRVSYMLTYGEIPKGEDHNGMCVCHSCDNPSCVNPNHLFLGTNQDNMDDRDKKGRCVNRVGEDHGNSKFIEVDITNIRAIYKYTKATYRQLAKIYSVSHYAIRCIVTRKTWKHVP